MDKRFKKINRPICRTIIDMGGKDPRICQQVERMVREGVTNNPLIAIHLAKCPECRRKFSS